MKEINEKMKEFAKLCEMGIELFTKAETQLEERYVIQPSAIPFQHKHYQYIINKLRECKAGAENGTLDTHICCLVGAKCHEQGVYPDEETAFLNKVNTYYIENIQSEPIKPYTVFI